VSAIIGRKLGMTRVFDEEGTAIPVTVVEAAPNVVTAIRKADRDGYDALQLAGVPTAERKLTKGELGHLKKAGADPMKEIVEFRDVDLSSLKTPKDVDAPAAAADDEGSDDGDGGGEDAPSDGEAGPKVGDQVTVSAFQPGQKVKVSAISIGKGFQGTIKRHNFGRGPVTHGSHNVRAPGSAGASADPARIFKGMKMPGRMGAVRRTQLGSTVVEVDADKNLLLIKGSVPGAKNTTVEVRGVG
jgi:large subunit ribosomal protein L3